LKSITYADKWCAEFIQEKTATYIKLAFWALNDTGKPVGYIPVNNELKPADSLPHFTGYQYRSDVEGSETIKISTPAKRNDRRGRTGKPQQ